MTYPPGNHQQEANHAPSSFNGVHLNNGKPIPETWCPGLKHNPGISMDWTLEEQTILENGLQKYALEPSVTRYAKIALDLQNKTVRDVALRCKWMTKKENSKRRKEGLNLARKIKDKRERVYPSGNHTHFAAQPNLPPYPTPMIPVDFNDGISYTGWILSLKTFKLNDMPDAMRQMPKLRERIKDKMFNYLLSPPPHPMQL
ncbi:Killer toxin KHS [Gossypium australe]|uniref:Killer toxin KHS n=1 Tax=Gossypium australe TaxID=47621 RepID=A0A5B6UEQ5_9ROSI|nr:Killer toxin KHS [Gossypium australe]